MKLFANFKPLKRAKKFFGNLLHVDRLSEPSTYVGVATLAAAVMGVTDPTVQQAVASHATEVVSGVAGLVGLYLMQHKEDPVE